MERQYHKLKIESEYFYDALFGLKMFEVRFNDRNFCVGDIVCLCEYIDGKLTGQCICREIVYVLDDTRYLRKGFVVLGLKRIDSFDAIQFISNMEKQAQ